jgi:diguanylate cyclase (GGDEF)-like protein
MHGRGELYEGKDVVKSGDVAAAPVSMARALPRSVLDARREIETLRSINAHLVRQIELLKQRESQAQHLADRDGLTGLYNRRKMADLLQRAVAEAARHGRRVAALFIDLDGFKQVNDRHGHGAGDKLLTTVASRLQARARHGDFVCRYGGDEFVVILPQVDDRDAALQFADSIRRRVAVPYRFDGLELRVTAAIGVAMYPDEARTGDGLIRFADESMYREKSRWQDAAPLLRDTAAPTRRRDDVGRLAR